MQVFFTFAVCWLETRDARAEIGVEEEASLAEGMSDGRKRFDRGEAGVELAPAVVADDEPVAA